MNDYLQEFIKSNHFHPAIEESRIYTNELKSEYFIVEEYSEKDFLNFFESDTTEKIIEEFSKAQQLTGFENLKKNTSLFLLVKVEDLNKAYDELRNQLILVEEDIYYFRKFVILYTEKAVSELIHVKQADQLYKLLNEKILSFEKNMFFEDGYFVAMELAIKIPFFKINHSKKTYQTIEEQFKDNQDEIDEQLLNLFKEDKDYISLLSTMSKGEDLLNELSNILNEEL